MSDHEKLISQINDGRQAQVCLNWLEPILAGLEKNNIEALKIAYRSGKYTETILASGISSLCSLQHLREILEAKVRQSQGAQLQVEEQARPGVAPSVPHYGFTEGITGNGK